SATIFHSLFFYGYGHPRDLHSFPTRRSSDLERRGVPFGRLARNHAQRDGHDRRGGRKIPSCRRVYRWRPAPSDRTRAGFLQADQDRKSTRLNSSHVAISYAVFCLKKKKHT